MYGILRDVFCKCYLSSLRSDCPSLPLPLSVRPIDIDYYKDNLFATEEMETVSIDGGSVRLHREG